MHFLHRLLRGNSIGNPHLNVVFVRCPGRQREFKCFTVCNSTDIRGIHECLPTLFLFAGLEPSRRSDRWPRHPFRIVKRREPMPAEHPLFSILSNHVFPGSLGIPCKSSRFFLFYTGYCPLRLRFLTWRCTLFVEFVLLHPQFGSQIVQFLINPRHLLGVWLVDFPLMLLSLLDAIEEILLLLNGPVFSRSARWWQQRGRCAPATSAGCRPTSLQRWCPFLRPVGTCPLPGNWVNLRGRVCLNSTFRTQFPDTQLH